MIVLVASLLFQICFLQCASCFPIENNIESSNNSTEPDYRRAYELAMNQTVNDYYAQRKAVMDRYYARQREIMNEIRRKSSLTTVSPKFTITDTPTGTSEENVHAEDEKENSDNDLQEESSSKQLSWTERKEIPGYYKLGEFKNSKDEKVVYQHNLGVGLKGPSQLEANFEVVLEGAFSITVIEAFPYANTRAHFNWISGGPGTNSVQLKLRGYENEGFSYIVKVWGVPLQD